MATEEACDTDTGVVQPATVLIVDDEPELVGMHATMLEDRYEVKTATRGAEALDRLDPTVDVILMDRRMPEISGDELAQEIRARDFDVKIALVTAVEPELEVLKVPFDAYVVKPVRKRDLREIVEHLHDRRQYSAEIQELLTVSARLAAIETSHAISKLEAHPEYRQLRERRDTLLADTHTKVTDILDWDQHHLFFRDLFGSVTG